MQLKMQLVCTLAAVALYFTTAIAAPQLQQKKYGPYPSDLPFIGKGTCGEPKVGSDGYTTVKCWGPNEQLAPGETRNVMMELENPYTGKGLFAVINMTAQLVDENHRPVPLSEVYVHHYVSRSEFLLGSGAELRGSFSRAPLTWPLTLAVNGTRTAQEETRITNIQLINTVGVAEADMRECLECWCEDSVPPEGGLATRGSFFCCKNCPSSVDAAAVNSTYILEYSVVFRPLGEAEQEAGQAADVVGFIAFDVTGGKIEYDLLEPLGPGTTHKKVLDTVIDERCPQPEPFTIVRCTAHQHVGSQCLSVYNLDKDSELVCRSCPIFGTEEGVAGNEKGYVVAIRDDDVSYEMQPGTRIRVESAYDGSERRLGLMGLMTMFTSGLNETQCTGQFGHAAGYSAVLHPMEQPGMNAF